MEMVINLIQEGNPQWSVMKDSGCSWFAGSKIWFKYKKNDMVKKKKHAGRPWKASKYQDRKRL